MKRATKYTAINVSEAQSSVYFRGFSDIIVRIFQEKLFMDYMIQPFMISVTKKIIIPRMSITENHFVPIAAVSFTILGKSLGFLFHICKQTHFLEVKDFL